MPARTSDKTSLTVPVELEIVAPGPPVVDYQGVLDNAVFVPGDAISPRRHRGGEGPAVVDEAAGLGQSAAPQYTGGGYTGAAERCADPDLLHVLRPDQLPDSDRCSCRNLDSTGEAYRRAGEQYGERDDRARARRACCGSVSRSYGAIVNPDGSRANARTARSRAWQPIRPNPATH